MGADNWKALADAVRRKREALGLRQADLEARGGPSNGTVRNVEQAAREKYASRTFAQLERALMWRPGTVVRILEGVADEDEVMSRWALADSDGRTWARVDDEGKLYGRTVRLVPLNPAVDAFRQVGAAAEAMRQVGAPIEAFRRGAAHADLGGLAAHAGGEAVDLPHGDAVARLAVELLGALAVQPTRTDAEQELAEHLHRFVGARLGG